MTNAQIIESIGKWDDIRNNNTALIANFNEKSSFLFDFPSYGSSSTYIHAYPGIYNDALYFFLIPSAYDTATYKDNFSSYVTVCQVVKRSTVPTSTTISTITTSRITQTEGDLRIGTWDSEYDNWIPGQTATTDGIFKAFAIPVESFEVAKSQVNMALKSNTSGPKTADLVIVNKNATNTYYDNFTKPVPPFGAATPLSSFYLLQLI